MTLYIYAVHICGQWFESLGQGMVALNPGCSYKFKVEQ